MPVQALPLVASGLAALGIGGAQQATENLSPEQKLELLKQAGQTLTGTSGIMAMKDKLPEKKKEEEEEKKPEPDPDIDLPDIPKKDEEEDTRGAGKQYHGAKGEIELLIDGYYNNKNYYGNGFYTTDALDIAEGYKGKKDKGVVYEVLEKKENKLFDLENKITKKNIEDFENYLGPSLSESINFDLNNFKGKSWKDAYDEIRDDLISEDMTANDITDELDIINEFFAKDGYDGITYEGGKLTGVKPHSVKQYFYPEESVEIKQFGQTVELDDEVPEDLKDRSKFFYEQIGLKQREEPEDAMLDATRFHSGVLAKSLEDIGDLSHRITEGSPGAVLEKVNRQIKMLEDQDYKMPFLENHEQNILGNVKYKDMTVEEYKSNLDSLLKNYVSAHEKLPTYNPIHQAAKDAAISIGKLDVDGALKNLYFLKNELEKGDDYFKQQSLSFEKPTVKKAYGGFIDKPLYDTKKDIF